LIIGEAVYDRDVFGFDIASLFEALPKSNQTVRERVSRCGVDETNHWHCRLLRARRQRPSRRAAEQGYHLAPSYVGHGLPLGTRCASLPHAKVAPEGTGLSLGQA
jgi:hypothetical protein